MKLEELRKGLRIDPDDLDSCLVEQPDLYYHVSEAHEVAVARRDAVQLDLDEAMAEEDRKLRDSIAEDEKLTEAAIKNRLRLVQRIKDLNRDLLAKSELVGVWGALKSAYEQRSKMLRELVQRHISELASLGLSRSVQASRNALADSNRAEAGRMRQQKGLNDGR